MLKLSWFGIFIGFFIVATAVPQVQADEKGGNKDVSLTGEIIDTYCYATMGARGASHASCGKECAQKGIPMGLLEKGTSKVYVLLPNQDKTAIPSDVMDKMGQDVTITGHAYTKNGERFLTVENVK